MYSITQIQAHIQASATQIVAAEALIAHLLFDSRILIFPSSSLFFAIVGARNDGHQYIADLYEKGVRNFVIMKPVDYRRFPEANFIVVEDTILALQTLTTWYRQQFDLEVIGITGSNGKTMVKEWLFQLLHPDSAVVRSPKSYNSQIGVPLSVWQIKKTHQIGIFEAGISQRKEMARLAPIIDCRIGVFTNIGSAHDEGFCSIEEKVQEKLALFRASEVIIVCKDVAAIYVPLGQWKRKELWTWSWHDIADLQLLGRETIRPNWTRLEAWCRGRKITIEIPFTDEASIENAIHCWAVLLYKNYPQKTIQERMRQLEAVAMRLELKEGINDCTIIDDSYNSDLNALRLALQFMKQQSQHERKTLILSDIFQSGLEEANLYQQVAQILEENGIQRLIAIGTAIQQLPTFLTKKITTHLFPNTAAFLEQFAHFQFEKESILIKGARAFAFERISNRLSQKVHQTVLEVNLSALTHNLKVYSQLLQPKTQLLAMVKAFAYGSGSDEVARLLEFHQVDYLGVAYADEGIDLRKAGIQTPILVLNSEEAVFEDMISHNLEPEIYSLRQLERFLKVLPVGKKAYPIHLKLDTGMYRLGFEAADLRDLGQILNQYEDKVVVKSIFSHFAASEAPTHDAFTEQQFQRFQELYKQITSLIGTRPLRHIVNSSGINRFPQYQLDMVRLGIGLYGIDSSGAIQEQLQVVNCLKATISQIKTVPLGETVGYGRKGKLPQMGRIAIISIGYADGLLRQAGNGNYHVYLYQKYAPIVGNVCMDMCMIDVTAIPEAKEGDIVEIFGEQQAVTKLAQCLQTIPYEIFTNISNRVKRIYYQE